MAVAVSGAMSIPVHALPLAKYASSSKLAQGTWRTIKINEEGMQFISYQQLKNMGFSQPEKVRVYGYGGRKVSESLSNANFIDDLPMQPYINTGEGIVFFGSGTVTWETRVHTDDHNYRYYPTQNPYSTESIYFLSDIDAPQPEIPTIDGTSIDSSHQDVDWYYARLLHEKELSAPSNSGTWMLGEDFRMQRTQTFPFKLPGLHGQRAYISTAFGAKATVATTLKVKANGEELFTDEPSTDTIMASGSSDDMLQCTVKRGTALNAAENMELEVTYNPSGVVYLANLDYICISYPRELAIPDDGSIHFYNATPRDTVLQFNVKGCSPSTHIWDITNPAEPIDMKYILDGTTARFTSPLGNNREFIAFEPSRIKRAPQAGAALKNQDIHAMAVPDMVIITPELYKTQAERVADYHRKNDKMTVYVLTPELLYNEFSSGSPDVTAFRKALKMWYDRGLENGTSKLKHCLLFGRPTYDQRLLTDAVKNCGYPRTLAWQNNVRNISSITIGKNGMSMLRYRPNFYTSQHNTYFTDDYLAMLQDNADGTNVDIVNAKMLIGVGRFPVRYLTDCKQAVDKFLNYAADPGTGFWRNKAMLIADDGNNAEHITQSEWALNGYLNTEKGASIVFQKVYLDAFKQVMSGTGATFPDAKQKMMQAWDEGVMFTQYVGHANPKEWTAEGLLTYTDINSFTNKRLPVWYTATCEFSRADADEISGGEIIWANPDAGAIAMLSTNRTVYITQNGLLTDKVGKYVFATDSMGRGLPLGDILMHAKNDVSSSMDGIANKRRFILLGDPAMRMPLPRLNVKVECIDGVELYEDPDDPLRSSTHKNSATLFRFPVLNARTQVKVSGSIVNSAGECITDFNGHMEYELYDGESVTTTFGSASDSPVIDFNDRNNRLFMGNTEVKNGKWEAILIIPPDIQNVTTKPLLSLYARASVDVEASGHTSCFYINGWNPEIDDTDGPDITKLVLNSPSFKNGDPVSSRPVVFGEMTDPNGISIASYGIGHSISLTLDGEKVYNDVDKYLIMKQNDIYSMSFAYPMPEIDAGKHVLSLDVWDNMGNHSVKDVEFIVAASPKPYIYSVTTDANPAHSSVTFTITHDRMQEANDIKVDVFDLNGRKLWSASKNSSGNYEDSSSLTWDLTSGGVRVARGIYIYRATLTTQDGVAVSRTNKIAVAAD